MPAVMKLPSRTSFITVAGAAFTVIFLLLALFSPAFIDETIEAMLLDYRFRIRNLIRAPDPGDDILIVAIDEETLEEFGTWPLDRRIQAELIRRIMEASPRVLGVDIFYAERQNREADMALEEVFEEFRGRIVLAAGFDREEGAGGDAPGYLWDHAIMKIRKAGQVVDALGANIVRISNHRIYSQALMGHVWSPADLDGKLRREHLFLKYGGDYYPSFALLTAAHSLGLSLPDITIHGGSGVSLGGIFIPTDPAGRVFINYAGREGTFRYIPAADVLKGRLSASIFRNRTVLLGASALQTFDPVVTPFSPRMPGVEKNATVVENILHERFIRQVPVSVTLLAVLVTGLVLAFLLPGMRAVPGLTLSLVLVLLFAVVNQALFTLYGLYLNFIYPFLTMFLTSLLSAGYKYATEERKARELRRMFSSYVSPKIVDELMNNPEKARLGGERREVTILFSDIRGFTSFSEKREPEEVVSMLNEYFKEMTDIIFRWDGTLDKFVGDEIMAFWGAPVDQPDHAELAVRCALDMSDRLNALQQRWQEEGKPVLDCGIGINTGSVLIGNIGAAGKKMDYTAIGDHVNLGARVEALTRDFNARILITEYTFARIRHLIDAGSLGHIDVVEGEPVKVKGKDIPVRIYSLSSIAHRDDY